MSQSNDWHLNLDQPTRSQFPGGRRRPVKGTYDAIPSSPRWRWNSRDTASVGATIAVFQPLLITTSYQLDSVAAAMMPSLPKSMAMGAGFWLALAGQTLAVGLIKGLANLMRSHGASLLKDLFAWLSLLAGDFIRASIRKALFGWLPWNRRRRKRDDEPKPPGPWKRWRERRRRRRRW